MAFKLDSAEGRLQTADCRQQITVFRVRKHQQSAFCTDRCFKPAFLKHLNCHNLLFFSPHVQDMTQTGKFNMSRYAVWDIWFNYAT